MSSKTLLAVFSLLTVGFSCEIRDNLAVCDSLSELLAIKSSKNWEIITVESSGKAEQVLNDIVFKNVPNVGSISIAGNNITDIQPGTFNRLRRLENVSIVGNLITTVKAGVFVGLRIRELDLGNNKIQFIENQAFIVMTYLKKLDLSNNELTSFDTKLLLNSSPSLQVLKLNKNNLKSLSNDTFEGLPNLKYLFLNNNQLDTLSNSCFHGLTSLKTLDISSNYINEIFPSPLPTLTKLYLHNNHLCFLHPNVFQRIPNVRKLSYGGNPWQCPCWELLDKWVREKNISRLCHEEYIAGQRPECIVTDFAPKECVYDKEKLNEVPVIFMSETAAYEKISDCEDGYE